MIAVVAPMVCRLAGTVMKPPTPWRRCWSGCTEPVPTWCVVVENAAVPPPMRAQRRVVRVARRIDGGGAAGVVELVPGDQRDVDRAARARRRPRRRRPCRPAHARAAHAVPPMPVPPSPDPPVPRPPMPRPARARAAGARCRPCRCRRCSIEPPAPSCPPAPSRRRRSAAPPLPQRLRRRRAIRRPRRLPPAPALQSLQVSGGAKQPATAQRQRREAHAMRTETTTRICASSAWLSKLDGDPAADVQVEGEGRHADQRAGAERERKMAPELVHESAARPQQHRPRGRGVDAGDRMRGVGAAVASVRQRDDVADLSRRRARRSRTGGSRSARRTSVAFAKTAVAPWLGEQT